MFRRPAVDGRPAGKAQAEQARDLVEGLAGGVVYGLAEAAVAAVVLHEDDVAVAAGDDQDERGEARAFSLRVRWFLRVFGIAVQPGGVDVALEVVYGHEGQPE